MSVMFVAVYLLSPYFACALPCCSFAEISPDVILRDEVRNARILLHRISMGFGFALISKGIFIVNRNHFNVLFVPSHNL